MKKIILFCIISLVFFMCVKQTSNPFYEEWQTPFGVPPFDEIKEEQALLELETDKAVIEVPASDAGKISKILVKDGDEIKIGQVILELEAAGNGAKKRIAKRSDSIYFIDTVKLIEMLNSCSCPKYLTTEAENQLIFIN